MKSLNQTGSNPVVIMLAIAVVAVAGFAGYRVLNAAGTNSNDTVSSRSNEPKAIKSTADVRKASAALDDIAIDGSVNPAQLDSDLNAVL